MRCGRIIMGAHMQRNSDSHCTSIRRDPPARPRSRRSYSMPDAVNSSGIAIAAQSKDCTCCASAESSTSRTRKLRTAEPNDHSAVQQLNFVSDSGCCLGSVNAKPRKLSEHHRCAAIGDSSALCSCSPIADCNYDRRLWRDVTGEKRNCDDEIVHVHHSSTAHELAIVQDTVRRIIVCCMCGDAGIADLLFLCSKCYRHQHIYCSRSYPSTYEEISICNWCLYEQDSISSRGLTKACYHGDFNRRTHTTISNAPSDTALHNVCHESCIDNEMVSSEPKRAMSQLKTHSKAFEYLLLVAAQSLPQIDRSICRNGVEIHITSSSNSNGGFLHRGIEIAEDSVTPVQYTLNSRTQQLQDILNPSNIDPPDKKSSIINVGSHQNIRLHNQVNISIDRKDIDAGRLMSGSVPKRHRYNKGINASLKCRKKGLQLSPSKHNYRRYKLLADVVC